MKITHTINYYLGRFFGFSIISYKEHLALLELVVCCEHMIYDEEEGGFHKWRGNLQHHIEALPHSD